MENYNEPFTSQWRCIINETHFVYGGLLDEARGVCRQEAVGGHDVDLISSSLLQNLSCCHKVLYIINNVILQGRNNMHYSSHQSKRTVTLIPSPKIRISYDNDGDAASNISDNSDGWFLLGHHYYKNKHQLVFRKLSIDQVANQSYSNIRVDWVRWVQVYAMA